jgi:hypothetical protein
MTRFRFPSGVQIDNWPPFLNLLDEEDCHPCKKIIFQNRGGRFAEIDAFALFDTTLLPGIVLTPFQIMFIRVLLLTSLPWLAHANGNYPTTDSKTPTGDTAYGKKRQINFSA